MTFRSHQAIDHVHRRYEKDDTVRPVGDAIAILTVEDIEGRKSKVQR
jgi:hypothetical protein